MFRLWGKHDKEGRQACSPWILPNLVKIHWRGWAAFLALCQRERVMYPSQSLTKHLTSCPEEMSSFFKKEIKFVCVRTFGKWSEGSWMASSPAILRGIWQVLPKKLWVSKQKQKQKQSKVTWSLHFIPRNEAAKVFHKNSLSWVLCLKAHQRRYPFKHCSTLVLQNT